jgi:kynurenine formamidase
MPSRGLALLLLLMISCLVGCGGTQPPADTTPAVPRIVDLSYAFDQNTVYWPNNESFQHKQVAFGRTPTGYWYSSYTFAASEHGGTHLDAPIHFAEGAQSVEQIPIARHIGPGVKISVAEPRLGAIPAGALVLVHTGWGGLWGNRALYLGT